MQIKKIRIRNFRSIRNQTIDTTRMNIFVGNNDVGKSNILKALNLFFNNETEVGRPFNFESDFTNLYNQKSKEAKEIRIAVTFITPSTYKDGGEVIWEKVWRSYGLNSEKESMKKIKPKGEFSPRSRVPVALRRIKYRYVPAIKSSLFFKNLLGTLHDTMALSLGPLIQTPMNEFSKTLQNATESLSVDIKKSLGFDSLIATPNDLRELFETLNFDTFYTENTKITLDFRGDGIKSRHIPLILKYIAEQDSRTRTSGTVRIFTFWGYEEPENSLELSKSFELSTELYAISKNIPMFITTHSPAFYLCAEKEEVLLNHVTQANDDSETSIIKIKNLDKVNEDMGLLHLVSPYIKEHVTRNKKLKAIIDDTAMLDLPTVFVEGITDKLYIEKACSLYNDNLYRKIGTGEFRIYASEEFGGVKSVKEWIEAWVRTQYQSKMIAIFDNDEAAKLKKQELNSDSLVQDKLSKRKIKIYTIPKTETLIRIWSAGVELEYQIEHYFEPEKWNIFNSCLDEKSRSEFPHVHDNVYDIDVSEKQNIINILGEDITNNYILKKVNKHKKKRTYNKLIKAFNSDDSLFGNFELIINDIHNFLEI